MTQPQGLIAQLIAVRHGAQLIRVEALRRLLEISDHGCEAASARSFEEGRLAVLDALGLGAEIPSTDTAEEIQQRRLDLDDALRTRGTRPGRDPLLVEPIVRSSSHD